MSLFAYKIKGNLNKEEPIEDVAVSHNSICDVFCIKVGDQKLCLSDDELERLCFLMQYDGWFGEKLEKMRKLMDPEDYPYEILSARHVDDEHWEKE